MLFLLLSCFLFSGVVHFSALIDEMIEDSAADDDNVFCFHLNFLIK